MGANRENACHVCGAIRTEGATGFCAACGTESGAASGSGDRRRMTTAPRGAVRIGGTPSLAFLTEAGDVSRVVALTPGKALPARELLGVHDERAADVNLTANDDAVLIDPVDAHHAVFVFLTEPTVLRDGDVLLLGSQVIRYRDLRTDDGRYFGGQTSERVGSYVPSPDLAVLEQIREDGRVRDTVHLWQDRSILIGRELGEWVFPYDPTMSGRHAEVVCGNDGRVTIRDVGSRNGVALRARGTQRVLRGQRMSLGGHLMRVELT